MTTRVPTTIKKREKALLRAKMIITTIATLIMVRFTANVGTVASIIKNGTIDTTALTTTTLLAAWTSPVYALECEATRPFMIAWTLTRLRI